MDNVAGHLLRRMYEHETSIKISDLADLIIKGKDWHWIACYFHHLLHRHGLVGNRVVAEQFIEIVWWQDILGKEKAK